MASKEDGEGKDDLMDLSPFMQNYVLNNPFSASGLISSGNNAPGDANMAATQGGLQTGYVGSNTQYAMSLKKQWLSPRHHPVRQWLKKEFTESVNDRVSADLVFQEAVKHFPLLTPQLLTRIVRATYTSVNKVPTKRGCTFQGMADRSKKNRFSLDHLSNQDATSGTNDAEDLSQDGDTEWWGSDEEEAEEDEWRPPSSHKENSPSKRWCLRKRPHSTGSVHKRQYSARSLNKAKAVLRSKTKTDNSVGSPKYTNHSNSSPQAAVDDMAIMPSSIKSEVCDSQPLSESLPTVSQPSETPGGKLSHYQTFQHQSTAQNKQTDKLPVNPCNVNVNDLNQGALVQVKEEPEENGFMHSLPGGSAGSLISDLQVRVTEVEAELHAAQLQCQAQTLRNEQLVSQVMQANSALLHRNSQVATLGAQFLDLSNQFNKVSQQFQALLFDIQAENDNSELQNGN